MEVRCENCESIRPKITVSAVVASAAGYTIGDPQAIKPARFPTTTAVPAGKSAPEFDYKSQSIVGYPKVPPPNAYESGGSDDDLLPPFEDSSRSLFFKRNIDDAKVDPKTGYPLVAQPSWKYSGGNEDSLELPLEDPTGDEKAVDPKTGYPLLAQPQWKDAGGDGDIIALPLEDAEDNLEEAVDPKTGYPLKADPRWKDAGGNEDVLELPLEDPSQQVDPKTGYPLVAQESWKHSGGDGDILQLPLEDPAEEAVDPKTGYPLVAQPGWRNAGGDGDILQLPLEDSNETSDVDPKTGYPLKARPEWRDAGGNGDFLQLPLDGSPELVDPKTGYPLVAQPSWSEAGGDGDILQPPPDPSENKNSLQLPSDVTRRTGGAEYHEFEIFKLTELQPPVEEKNFPTVSGNSFSTPSPFSRKSSAFANANQKRNSFPEQRPAEASYTYTGPDNVVVTVTRFLSGDRQENPNYRSNIENGVGHARSNFEGGRSFQNNFQTPVINSFRDYGGSFGRQQQQGDLRFDKRPS